MNDPKPVPDQMTNLKRVQAQMEAAKASSSIAADDIKLIAVSKVFGPEHIGPVLDEGHRIFGENRVQEAKAKWPNLKERYPDVELHLIGPLQSNKVKDAVALFDWVHSIDRPSLAEALSREIRKAGRSPNLLVQVNTGNEPQKAGIAPNETRGFIDYCQKEIGLQIRGLMCIPPVDEEPALHFSLLRKLAVQNDLKELSMGMSADFEVAIEFGATMVRVGSAIFGLRPKPEKQAS